MSETVEEAPITRTGRIRDGIAHQIRSYIVRGALAPGARLPSEKEFAALYKVSRPSIREALVVLHLEGHIDIQRGNASYVSAPVVQPGSAFHCAGPMELLDARITIECRVAAEFAQLATREDIDRLRTLVRSMHSACCITAHQELTRAFRRVLTSVTCHQVVGDIIDNLCVEMFTKLSKPDDNANLNSRTEETLEHVEILDAISKADARAAASCMRFHLLGVAERLKEFERPPQSLVRLRDNFRST